MRDPDKFCETCGAQRCPEGGCVDFKNHYKIELSEDEKEICQFQSNLEHLFENKAILYRERKPSYNFLYKFYLECQISGHIGEFNKQNFPKDYDRMKKELGYLRED